MKVADIATKYTESQQFLEERKRRQVAQLVLLNNLQRGDMNIASTLLITLFNRILSSLYDDRLQIKFVPSEEVSQEKINSFNLLAQSDYMEMEKSKLDYDWCWDTLFFGRGYMETLSFNKKRKIMEPVVINPLMFGHDPYNADPQHWRYYWKWVTKNKWEIEKLIKAKAITGVKKAEEIASGMEERVWEYKTRRDRAKLAVEPAETSRQEDIYQILEFYGHDEKGDKCVWWVDKKFSQILLKEKLDLKDGEGITAPNGDTIKVDSKWPIVCKEAFREPHSSIMFSVADLLEDKHRAKSVLLNLAFIAAKDRANPIYGYNPDKVQDITQFFSRQINQHIPMDDPDAAWPLNTEDPMSAGLVQFISMLTQEANEPIGTGMAMQPLDKKTSDTATEAAITQQLNDMAQSLQSKVMQFGEKEFWSHWFHRYQANYKEGDTKMAAIVGIKGTNFEKVDLGDFKTSYPPGVLVYSAKEAEYKELVMRRDLMQLYPQLQMSLGPDGMRNFNKYVFFPKFLQDPTLVDIMLPKTLDELKAEEENEMLRDNEMLDVAETDNHETHIYTHYMVTPKTNATWFHIAWHEEELAKQKAQEAQQQRQMMVEQQSQSLGQKPEVSKEDKSPMNAASPLESEISNDKSMINN